MTASADATAAGAAAPSGTAPSQGRSRRGVRVVAALEAAKAAIVLVAGSGLLWAIQADAARTVEELVGHMHLNVAKGFPRVFADLAGDISNVQLWLLASGAFGYSLLRGIEAFGLWRQRRWAEWFSVASGCLYVPFELFELVRGVTSLRLATLLLNLGIVAYMAYTLRQSSRHQLR